MSFSKAYAFTIVYAAGQWRRNGILNEVCIGCNQFARQESV